MSHKKTKTLILHDIILRKIAYHSLLNANGESENFLIKNIPTEYIFDGFIKNKSELKRLNDLGGIDRIVATEGLVFFYNGKTYKLTGTFAPLNQILGLFY